MRNVTPTVKAVQSSPKDKENGRAAFYRGIMPDPEKHSLEFYESWCRIANAHQAAALEIFGEGDSGKKNSAQVTNRG